MNVERLIGEAQGALVAANERFGDQGSEEDEAWELLEHAWGRDFEWEDEVPTDVARSFRRLVGRRETGEPVSHIVGYVEFRDMRLGVRPGMFIPRGTSEFLAAQAIRRLHGRHEPVHVDLATGVGPIALSTARAVSQASVWGLDVCSRSLGQARRNAAALGLENITFRKSDMFAGLPARLHGGVDVVTIHPPYVPRSEVADLPEEIRGFEPSHTLTDGSRDGLLLVRRAIDESPRWLRPGGWLLMEIVPTETRGILPLFRRAGFRQVRSTHGALRYTRVLVGRL